MEGVAESLSLDIDSDEVATSKVNVSDLAGNVVLLVGPPPPKRVVDLKIAIEEQHGTPASLQRLIQGDRLLHDSDTFPQTEDSAITLIVDETPLYAWDIEGNPLRANLNGDGSQVTYPEPYTVDYIHVMTQAPVQKGTHYFEFVMHHVGDEQWCGVVADKAQAGNPTHPYNLKGWAYYCGRRSHSKGKLQEWTGAGTKRDVEVAHVKSGDVIGMVVNLDVGMVAFSVNGVVQGSLQVPKVPLYLMTLLDWTDDHVELRKPPLDNAPEGLIVASSSVPEPLVASHSPTSPDA